MQYTPTNKRKFDKNVARYRNLESDTSSLARREQRLRDALRVNLSHVTRANGEEWSHFMARLTNEYRRARNTPTPAPKQRKNTSGQKRKSSPGGSSSAQKKAKPSSPGKKKNASNNPVVVKKGHRSGGLKNQLGTMSNAEIESLLKKSGYESPDIIKHIHTKSPVALKLARKHVVWPMVHTIKKKRQPWGPHLFHTSAVEISNTNHREMLKYLGVFPSNNNIPKELKAKMEPDGNKRYYAKNTLRAILGTEANRQQHINTLRRYHRVNVKSGKKLPLPFSDPIVRPLERLIQMSKNNHKKLEELARKEGYNLKEYNKLNNATKKQALPLLMYNQSKPTVYRRHRLQSSNNIRKIVPTVNVNATKKVLRRAVTSKKITNLRPLVDSLGWDLMRDLVKASGFHEFSITKTLESPEARKALVAYLRQKIPNVDNILKE